MKATLLF